MAKAYILDAYNVIHSIPFLASKMDISLESARKALVVFLINWKKRIGFKGMVYVVFDGRDNIDHPAELSMWGVKCMYTSSKVEADDKIMELVRNSQDAKNITVVTRDGRIINSCKVNSAKVVTPESLLTKTKRRKSEINDPRSKNAITARQEKEVDKYYKEMLGL